MISGISPSAPPVETRQVWYPPEMRRQEFLNILDRFARMTEADGIKRIVGQTWLDHLRVQDRQIRERLAAEFSLVVIGDFKRGKSTLINALLGMPVVTANVTPETVTINQVRYGATPRLEAHVVDGGRVTLSTGELAAERLTCVLERLAQPVDHLQIEAPVEWLRGIQIVDTPGLGDLLQRFDKQVQAYLPRADAVLYVISALSPLSESERMFLRSALRPQQFPRILFVVNTMDAFESEEQAGRVLASVKAKLSQMFPGAPVFGLSALDEFCRLQGLERPNPALAAELEGGFALLRDHLHDAILLKRDLIQIDRAVVQAEAMLGDYAAGLERLRTALEADQAQLDAAIIQLRDQASALHQQIDAHKKAARQAIEAMRVEAAGWLEAFVDRLQTEAVRKLARFQYEDIQRHFHFFLSDVLREAVACCLEAHQPLLMKQLKSARELILDHIQHQTNMSASVNLAVDQATFSQAAWSDLDTLNWLADKIPLHLAGFSTTLLTVVAELAEKASVPKRIAAFQRQLEEALPALRQSVAAQVQSIYQDIAVKVELEIDQAWQQELAANLTALQQAQELRGQGEQRASGKRQSIQETLAGVTSVQSGLDELQRKLRLDL